MTVTELLNTIKQHPDYFINSLYLKSSDDYGCVYKWLVKGISVASRKEIFIALDPEESELELLNKTVLASTEVYPSS